MANDTKKLAFLGLGVMGYPMAGHLARAGHEVTVYNRSSAKADAWARALKDPRFKGCQISFAGHAGPRRR